MFETMMNDDEKGKIFTSKGIYEERNLGHTKTNFQEVFMTLPTKMLKKPLSR